MSPSPTSKKKSSPLKVAGRGVATIAGACALYLTVAAISVMPEMPKIADNFYAASTVTDSLGLSPQFPLEHPYLNSFVLQAGWLQWSVLSGQSVDAQYSHEWRLSDETLNVLRHPAYGSYGVLTSACSAGKRQVFGLIAQAAPGFSAQNALRFDAEGWFKYRGSRKSWTQLTEAGPDFAMVATAYRPWWHLPAHALLTGIPDRHAELAKEFPGLALDCQAVAHSTVALGDVIHDVMPEVAPLLVKPAKGTGGATKTQLSSLELGEVEVTHDAPEADGPWVSLVANTQNATEQKYEHIVARLSKAMPVARITVLHSDGKRTLQTAFLVKGGVVEVHWGLESGKSELRLHVRAFGDGIERH